MDLYVRESNKAAIEMYRKMGYSVYRRVVKYYSDGLDERGGMVEEGEDGERGEDAFDMRKPLSRDKGRKYVREGGEEYRVGADEVF